MTGSGAGAIDFDRLMENLRVREISIEAADSGAPDETMRVQTFCLDAEGVAGGRAIPVGPLHAA